MATTSHSLSTLHFPKIPSCKIPILPFSLSSRNPLMGHLSFSLFNPSLPSISLPTRHGQITAVVSFSLPNAIQEGVAGEKVPKWSWRAIKSFAMGELEARKFKYATTGTEAILMGILIEGTSLASKLLRANGITLTKVKEECIKLLGKGDFFYFSPEHPPLTESAKKALDWAVNQKLISGENGEVTATDLLLGIWTEEESSGHKILATLGFDDEKAKKLKSLSSEPGFDEG